MKDVSGGDGSCPAKGICFTFPTHCPCLLCKLVNEMDCIQYSVYVQVNVIHRHRHSAAQQTDDLLSQSFG